jgi:hypothetical protein
VLAANWAGGHPGPGPSGLAVMAAFGAFLLLAAGNETVRGLTTGRDERFAQIDLRATAVAGLVLITTLIVAWLADVAQGRTGSPCYWLAATGGLACILAVAFFRWRG